MKGVAEAGQDCASFCLALTPFTLIKKIHFLAIWWHPLLNNPFVFANPKSVRDVGERKRQNQMPAVGFKAVSKMRSREKATGNFHHLLWKVDNFSFVEQMGHQALLEL